MVQTLAIPPPSRLGLPHDRWRENQDQAISDILEAPTRFVLVEAPPGVGKSGIAVGVGRLRGADQGDPNHYLTATKALQNQYAAVPGMVTVRGRANFPCALNISVTADEAECNFGYACPHAGKVGEPGCAYFDQKRRAMEAQDVVWNYAYWLRLMNGFSDGFAAPGLIVLDEAHTIRSEVEGFVTRTVRLRTLERAGLGIPRSDFTLGGWRRWAKETRGELHPIMAEVNPQTDRYVWKQYDALNESLRAIGKATEGFICEEMRGGLGWEIKPVWAHDWVPKVMFSRVQDDAKIVMMSATLLDPELFCQMAGIPRDEATFLRYPSPFDPRRRPLRYWPVAKVSGRLDEGTLGVLADAVDEVLEHHPGEKGIIHTTNYGIARAIWDRSRHRARLLTHDGKNRGAVLDLFRGSRLPQVLLSPSMTTGVDLPYEGCRFQVICKLPFPDISSLQRKKQLQYQLGRELVNYDTAAALVQTYGRAMRAEDDWGVTYLLDQNFNWFKEREHGGRFLPPYMTKAIEWDPVIGSLNI